MFEIELLQETKKLTALQFPMKKSSSSINRENLMTKRFKFGDIKRLSMLLSPPGFITVIMLLAMLAGWYGQPIGQLFGQE